MHPNLEAELIAVVRQWDLALVTNDPDAIGRYMADDWIIIGADGTTTDKTAFLGLVTSGALTHDVMESSWPPASSSGQQGEWRCVLTHLSRLRDPVPP